MLCDDVFLSPPTSRPLRTKCIRPNLAVYDNKKTT
jgi:hypothetical protein